ncbi:MAG: hypothetical protein M3Z97_08455 [Candidatus Dormibacteraeota bacterium]|nr:hypothetical protein [Candidatus Dormibacteraeota bacterium]
MAGHQAAETLHVAVVDQAAALHLRLQPGPVRKAVLTRERELGAAQGRAGAVPRQQGERLPVLGG